MKKFKLTFRAFILVVLLLSFYNCTKDESEPATPSLNYSTFTDSRDGKTYKTIKIGDQEWMAENLTYKTSSGSWYYWNKEEFGAKLGRLYTWEAAKMAVPAGWHLPTDAEWKKLEVELGMLTEDVNKTSYRGTDQGSKLKNSTGWSENGNGTNDLGFAALPGGFRSNSGNFYGDLDYCYMWTATEYDNSMAWFRGLISVNSKINRNTAFKGEGYSVRCVKDNI